MKNRFQFYEVVVVVDNKKESLQALIGREGTILGMSQDEESEEWGYAVSIESTGETWDIAGRYLESTGKILKRSDFYSEDSVKVKVEPNTGEGSLKDEGK